MVGFILNRRRCNGVLTTCGVNNGSDIFKTGVGKGSSDDIGIERNDVLTFIIIDGEIELTTDTIIIAAWPRIVVEANRVVSSSFG